MATNYAKGDRPVPDFELVQPLGRGGFGVVWKANGPGGIEAALKIINLTAKQGFKEFRGLQRVKNIRHPNLVFVYGFWLKDEYGNLLDGKAVDDQDSAVFAKTIRGTLRSPVESSRPAELIIAMGLGDNTLADRLQECNQQGRPGIPLEELLPYMEDAARGIDHLNASSVQHCDIKPSNIMIVGGAVQVCDFGLARLMGDVKATSPAMSVAYSAPEVLERNEPSPTTDQYSLAITYHELRTGALPFPEASPLQVMHFHMRGELDYSRLPPGEQEVLRKATSLDPSQRYTGSVEMVRALRRACQSDGGPDQVPYTPPLYVSQTASGSALRPGEIVPGYRLLRELVRSADDHVWLAQGVEGEVAMLVRDLNESPTIDLAALDVIKGLEHNRLTELRAYWLLDAMGNVVVAKPDDRDTLAEAAQIVVLGRLARKTLQQVLDERRGETRSSLDAPVALRFLRQVAEAVDFLNAPIHDVSGRRVSIQHRAIRPENIMCFGDSVKLGNFLSACLLEGPLTITDRPPESNQAYNAPETRDKVVTRWSDQYSMAVMYYQLRSGTLPSPGQEVTAPGRAALLDLSLLPDEERAVVAQATSANPKDRFNSCLELVEALERVIPAQEKLPEVEEQELEKVEEHGSGALGAPEIDLSFLGPEPTAKASHPQEVAPSISSKLAEAPPAAATSAEPFAGGTLEFPTPVRDTRGSSPLQETVNEQPVAPPPPELPRRDTDSGMLDGRYQLLEQVGEGAFAVVYRAKDSRLNKDVAVKVLKIEHTTDPARLVQLRDLFQREARMSARLEDPNIVHVSDAHVTPSGIPYLVTEFLEGRLFREVIDTESPLELLRVDALLEQLCSAVDTAHEESIVHRDLKPGNLMLVYSRSGERLKVLDFGLAKLVDQAHMSLTQGAPIGTPHYMSPEQHRGEDATALSDIYAVGVILFEMLTGRLPFDAPGLEGMELVHELRRLHCDAEPPDVTADRSALPPELNAVIRKALAKDPRERFTSAGELLAAYREAVAPKDKQTETREDRVAPPPARQRPIWLRPAGLLVESVAAAIVLLVVARLSGLWPSKPPPPPVETQPPIAIIEAPVYDAKDFKTVYLDAGKSNSPNGSISKIEWDFGDGQRGSGAAVSHQYAHHGKFAVKVLVTDAAGREDTAELEVFIRLPIHRQLQAAWDQLASDPAAAREEFDQLRKQLTGADDEGLRAWAQVGIAVADLSAEETDQSRLALDGVEEVEISELADGSVRICRDALAALFDDDKVAFVQQLRELRGENWASIPQAIQQHLGQRAKLERDEFFSAESTELKLLEDPEHYDVDLQTLLAALLLDRKDWQEARTQVEEAGQFVGSALTARREYLDLLWARTVAEDTSAQASQLLEEAAKRLTRWLDSRPQQDPLLPVKLKVLVQLGQRENTAERRRGVLERVSAFAANDAELAKSLGEPLAELVGKDIESRVRATDSPGEFRDAARLAQMGVATGHANALARTFLAEALLEENRESQIPAADVQRAAELVEAIDARGDWATYASYVEALVIFRGKGAEQPQLFSRPLEQSLQARENWSTALRDRRTRAMCKRLADELMSEQPKEALPWLVHALDFSRERNEKQELLEIIVRQARDVNPELAEEQAAVLYGYDPDHPLANAVLAIAESKKSDFSKALDHWDRMLAAEDVGDSPTEAKHQLDQLQTALDWATQAESTGANEQQRIGGYFDQRGRIIEFWHGTLEGLEKPWYEEARLAYEQAVAHDDTNVDYRIRLGNLLASPEFYPWQTQKIGELAEAVLKKDPNNPGALALQGTVYLLEAHGLLPHEEIRSLTLQAKSAYDRAIQLLQEKQERKTAIYLVNRSAILTFLGQHLDQSPEAKKYYLGKATLSGAMAEYARLAKEDAADAAREYRIAPFWVLEAWGNALEDEADYGTNRMELFQQAVEKFEACKDALPRDPNYQVNVGRTYYKWGAKLAGDERSQKWGEAAKALTAVVQRDRQSSDACEAFYFLGRMQLEQERPQILEAVNYFAAAVVDGKPKAPYWFECLKIIGQIYVSTTEAGKLKDEILADADKLKKDPGRAHAGFYLEGLIAYRDGNNAKAEETFGRGIAQFPDDFLLNLGRSQSLNRLHKYRDALSSADKAMQQARTAVDKVQALDARAGANQGLERPADAIDDLKNAFELAPDKNQAAQYAAEIALLYNDDLRDKARAGEWVKKGYQLDPDQDTRDILIKVQRLIGSGK